ncbi:FtsK/SpoIIIE domain-containing protein [Agromyces sp. H66]|uniref:FtsK/SpoIIIE domain-containing protein n=1 Tax=Agromyces sp. H66 TaxID=2529859 RepID=UPI0010AAFF13|nr:FtsK/SpoIIIE domain-containing protein [Agromyces sp. H66]
MDRSDPTPDEPVGPPIVLPPHPPEPPAAGFPLLATTAPVAGALVLWMATGSAVSLAFAALGPLVAVASVLDSRRQARRARRRGVADRAQRLESARAEIIERHAEERAAAWRRAPSARHLAAASAAADWREATPGAVIVGRGGVASGLRVDGTAVDAADRELVALAKRLDDAPVPAPAGLGIGIVGPPPLARATARGLLLQLAHRCRPDLVGIEVPAGAEWSWARRLPHHGGGGERVVRVLDDGGRIEPPRSRPSGTGASVAIGAAGAVIAVAAEPAALPPGLATVVHVAGHGSATVDRSGLGGVRDVVVPELIGAAEATAWADRMRAAAVREGYAADTALATRVDLDDLEQPVGVPGSRADLHVHVGVHRDGPLGLDLVAGGPHAIVAGTTGSGKSEFLLAWLAALAAVHPPDRVAFLLVDFKGGASFEPLRGLPHVTGIVTDLDESEAERAMLSLRAELRRRESVLRAERARDIVGLGPGVDLPRLVIVVDEFQAMVERFPELGAVIADIAARGRSLGVHLILASQRPNGVVREQVTANCSIRVSLRVMQRADSMAVVGTEAAASIRPDTPGRGVVDVGDGVPVVFQSARVGDGALARLRAAGAGARPARRPWLDPLPERLPARELDRAEATASLPPGALAIGLVDVPERQRHDVLAWSPADDGHLLVLGAPGSGRTTTLAAVARAAERRESTPAVLRLDGPRSRRWDILHAVLARVERAEPGPELLLLVDDLDHAFGDWPDDHRHAAIAALEAVLREGRRAGVHVAAAAGLAHRLGAGILEAFGRRLLLRHASRAELVHAGGSGELWRAHEPPGAGQWDGHRMQVVHAPASAAEPHPAPEPLEAVAGLYAVVSAAPRADLAALREAGFDALLLEPVGDTVVRTAIAGAARPVAARFVVGDADAWAANWSSAALAREEATVVVHGGPREHRVFHAGQGLPPLLDDRVTQCVVSAAGTASRRAGWPPRRRRNQSPE